MLSQNLRMTEFILGETEVFTLVFLTRKVRETQLHLFLGNFKVSITLRNGVEIKKSKDQYKTKSFIL